MRRLHPSFRSFELSAKVWIISGEKGGHHACQFLPHAGISSSHWTRMGGRNHRWDERRWHDTHFIFCTIATKYGYGIIRDLESGTTFLMQERGIKSMRELIGIAQPLPITDFMALSPVKKISEFNYELCTSCGNCERCPYIAIQLDDQGHPHSGPARCIRSSICARSALSAPSQCESA